MHLVLGPYFPWRLVRGQPIRYVKSAKELAQRSVYITYLNMLLIAYFIENPDVEMFVIAMASSFLALFMFVYKWYNIKNWYKTNMYEGILDHVLYFVIPLIFLARKYGLKLRDYKPGLRTLAFAVFLVVYRYAETLIYKGGRDV